MQPMRETNKYHKHLSPSVFIFVCDLSFSYMSKIYSVQKYKSALL